MKKLAPFLLKKKHPSILNVGIENTLSNILSVEQQHALQTNIKRSV